MIADSLQSRVPKLKIVLVDSSVKRLTTKIAIK